MNLLISLRSETLKLKRTISVYLCIIGAAFGPFMSFLENLDTGPNNKLHRPWADHFLEAHEVIGIAMVPFYTILVCTLLMQIEYRDKTWKQVLSSPQKLFNIFIAKFLTLQIMIFLFLAAYLFFLSITGFITEAVRPQIFDGSLKLYPILVAVTQLWILALGLSSVQFWLSLRFKNFIGPLAIGVLGWFLSPMLLFQFKTSLVEYYPYAFTILGVMPEYKAHIVTYQWYSVATALLFLTIAFAGFRAKRVKG
jgi:hypothetical protein